MPLAKVNSQQQAQQRENCRLNGGRAFVRGFSPFRNVAANAIARFEADRHPEK